MLKGHQPHSREHDVRRRDAAHSASDKQQRPVPKPAGVRSLQRDFARLDARRLLELQQTHGNQFVQRFISGGPTDGIQRHPGEATVHAGNRGALEAHTLEDLFRWYASGAITDETIVYVIRSKLDLKAQRGDFDQLSYFLERNHDVRSSAWLRGAITHRLNREAAREVNAAQELTNEPAAAVYQIWLRYWTAELRASQAEMRTLEEVLRRTDPNYAWNRGLFDDGRRDVFGPEYEEVANAYHTAQCLTSQLDDLLSWLEDWVDVAGHRVTFSEVNAKAREIAEGKAWFQTYMAPLILGGLGPGSLRTPAPGPAAVPAEGASAGAPVEVSWEQVERTLRTDPNRVMWSPAEWHGQIWRFRGYAARLGESPWDFYRDEGGHIRVNEAALSESQAARIREIHAEAPPPESEALPPRQPVGPRDASSATGVDLRPPPGGGVQLLNLRQAQNLENVQAERVYSMSREEFVQHWQGAGQTGSPPADAGAFIIWGPQGRAVRIVFAED